MNTKDARQAGALIISIQTKVEQVQHDLDEAIRGINDALQEYTDFLQKQLVEARDGEQDIDALAAALDMDDTIDKSRKIEVRDES